jgi:hypothetical protein
MASVSNAAMMVDTEATTATDSETGTEISAASPSDVPAAVLLSNAAQSINMPVVLAALDDSCVASTIVMLSEPSAASFRSSSYEGICHHLDCGHWLLASHVLTDILHPHPPCLRSHIPASVSKGQAWQMLSLRSRSAAGTMIADGRERALAMLAA